MPYQSYILRIYLGPTPFQSLSLLTTVNWGATARSWRTNKSSICAVSSKATFYRYLHEYQAGGVEKLQELNFHRLQSPLVEHKRTLEGYFREHPSATRAEAAARIEELTGVKRGPTQTRKFLKKLGMKPRKVGQIPAKADVKEQEGFKEEQLEPRLAEAKAGQRLVFFMDGRALCLCAVSRPGVVLRATVGEGPPWAPAIERAGGLKCHNSRDLHRPEPDLRHGRDDL
jgi:transposase